MSLFPRDAVFAPPGICARSGRPGPRRFSSASGEGAGAARLGAGGPGGVQGQRPPTAPGPPPVPQHRWLHPESCPGQRSPGSRHSLWHSSRNPPASSLILAGPGSGFKVLGRGVLEPLRNLLEELTRDINKAKRSADSRAPSCFLPLRLPVHCQQRGEKTFGVRCLEENPL